jgi:ubiquinone/menaquinone biosynthesis C-methylase UbiE
MPSEYEFLNSQEDHHLNDSFTIFRYKQMARFGKSDISNILDFGIGSGQGGAVLRNLFPSVHLTGIDAVKVRAEKLDSVYDNLVYSSTQVLPFEDDSFDFIVAGEILEHILISEVDFFLYEIYRVLKHGGVFVLTTPNPNDLKLRIRKRSILGGSHLSQHFPKATKLRLQLSGFRVTYLAGTGKTSRVLGTRFPLSIYGSYMIATKKS